MLLGHTYSVSSRPLIHKNGPRAANWPKFLKQPLGVNIYCIDQSADAGKQQKQAYRTLRLYSGALHYEHSVLQQNCFPLKVLRLQKRLQNDVSYGGISLCDDRFPASGTDSRKAMVFGQLIGGFKMAAGYKTWLSALFWDRFLAAQAAKMAVLWRIFAGLWVSSP